MKLLFLYTDELVLQNNVTLNNYGLIFPIYVSPKFSCKLRVS